MVKKTGLIKKKKSVSEPRIERALIENFVSLQKVMVNLSVKFDNLTSQISKLLELFEISAKALAEKDFSLEKEGKDTKKIIEKIDNLLDQNKIIARGVSLLHEPHEETEHPQQIQQIRPPVPSAGPRQSSGVERYQKSISSKSPQLSKQEGSS